MSNAHRESRELAKHAWLFNSIAPVYNLFFEAQLKNYRSVLAAYHEELGLATKPEQSVLDIGCGTGAFLTSLAELGYKGTGVDFSHAMLKAARRSTGTIRGVSLEFFQADATKGLPFADQSYDLVIAAYVLHGLQQPLRSRIYKEAKRLARQTILFYDYNPQRALLTDIVEWAEGGDYFNFIKIAEHEMNEHFVMVRRLDVGPHSAIYVCSPTL